MSNSVSKLKKTAIPMVSTQAAFRTAQEFANQQPIQSKRQEVYFNFDRSIAALAGLCTFAQLQ